MVGRKSSQKVSNGVANVTNMLDEYESDPDLTYLYVSAWITRVAVIDVVEANEFPSHYAIYAPIHGNQTKIDHHGSIRINYHKSCVQST